MSSRIPALASLLVLAATVAAAGVLSDPNLARQIDSLSAFDYATRMNAARMLRRTPAADAVPALAEAARHHSDQFVRYRALVLLTSFDDAGTGDVMRSLIGDRNDRVREIAYRWFERHPDVALTQPLLAALESEQAEFVRPALVRAVAALPHDDMVERALVAQVTRGLDFFRSAVIEVLGQRHAAHAVDAIAAVARLEGPLQDDALLALGRIGDGRARQAVSAVKPSSEAIAALAATECLLGEACAPRVQALVDAARNAAGRPEGVRAAVAALAAVAEVHADARSALIALADSPSERLQHEVALALSGVALREPEKTINWLARAPDEERSRSMALLLEGFQSLEEDFSEEQFFAALRAFYWDAAEASMARDVAATLIERLEF